MLERRDTVTNQLAHVILTLQLGGKTGTLTVEREVGTTLEEGRIVFLNGQVMQAQAGQLEGGVALSRLKTWTTCRYAFIPGTEGNLPKVSSPLPPPATNWLSNGHANPTVPLSRNTMPLPGVLPNGRGWTGQLEPMPSRPWIPYRIRELNEALSIIHDRGFSRIHRHLFLLIDGQRTKEDLAAIIRHRADELEVLLTDLEEAGLIRH